VNALYSIFTSLMPEAWPYILGALYVITVLYMKNGITGIKLFKKKATSVA